MRPNLSRKWLVATSCAAVVIGGAAIVQAESVMPDTQVSAVSVYFKSLLVHQDSPRADIFVGADNVKPTLVCFIGNATRDKTVRRRGDEIVTRLNDLEKIVDVKNGAVLAKQIEVRPEGSEWVLAVKGRDDWLITCDTIMARRVFTTTPKQGANALLDTIKINLSDIHFDQRPTMAPQDRDVDARRRLSIEALGQGDAYYADNQLDAAMQLYRKAIQIFPECQEAYVGLQRCYRERNNPGDDAKVKQISNIIEQLNAALDQKINGDKAWDVAMEAKGRGSDSEARAGFQTARQFYTKARLQFPKCDTFYIWESKAYEEAGNPAEAKAVLQQTIDDGYIVDDVPALPGRGSFVTRVRELEH